jgi:hypothetical protein
VPDSFAFDFLKEKRERDLCSALHLDDVHNHRRDEYHQENFDPVRRTFHQREIEKSHTRLNRGCRRRVIRVCFTRVTQASDKAENRETGCRHQNHGQPICEIPTQNVFAVQLK